MARVAIVGIVAMLTTLPLDGQSTSDQILQREEARAAASRSGQGRELFYSADFINVNPPGRVVLGFTAPAQPNDAYYMKYYMKDVKVIAATPSAAVLTGLQGPRPPTADLPSKTDPDRVLRVWVKEGHAWKVVASQVVWVRPALPIAPPKADVSNAPYSAKNAIEAAVVKVNDAINEAFRARDVAGYESHTAPEFVRISSFGEVTPRAEFVKNAVAAGTGARPSPAADEVRVRVYGDVAVVTFRNLRNADRMMRVFMNRGGAWKAVAGISTIIWPAAPK